MSELEEIRTALNLSQAEMGKLMGAAQSSYNRWESSPASKSSREALEQAKDIYRKRTRQEWVRPTAAPAGGPYVTEKDFAEWRGYWRGGMEGVLERLKALEDQVQKLRQQAESA